MSQVAANIPGFDDDGKPSTRLIVTPSHAAAFLLKLAAAKSRPA